MNWRIVPVRSIGYADSWPKSVLKLLKDRRWSVEFD